MANEITLTAKLLFTKGSVTGVSRITTDKGIDVTGTRYSQIVQAVDTTEEAMAIGDVPAASIGYCWMKNLDATNFMEVRPGTGTADLLKLKAGESCVFRITSSMTPWLIADTAACDVEILLIED